jgi:ubiquinone/menaquinone biosynthesis C-methylase UbiE
MPGRKHPRLTHQQTLRMETTLRSAWDDELAELLWKLRRRHHVANPPREALRHARELELLEAGLDVALRLTPLGEKVSDSLSEYAYWKQREKRHHWSKEVDALGVERLRGRRILEVGCGAGVNLLSLQACAVVVGLDTELLYLQFTQVLARLEGVPAPTRVCAMAERMPFEDESFDVALLHGSLPYMRIEPALQEVARVLRPAGRLIAIHSDLWQTQGIRARQRRWSMLSPRVFLRELRAATGTALYPWLGRLLLEPGAPVHATRGQMRRWLARAGLRVDRHESCTIAREVCYVAEKAANVDPR